MPTNKDVIGTAEAAAILGIDRSTLTRRVQRGTIKTFVRGTGHTGELLFRRSEIAKQLESSPAVPDVSSGAAGGHVTPERKAS